MTIKVRKYPRSNQAFLGTDACFYGNQKTGVHQVTWVVTTCEKELLENIFNIIMWYLLSTSKKNSSGNQNRMGCFVITVTASLRIILPYRSSIVVAWDIHGVFTGLVAVHVDKVPHSDILIFHQHCVTQLLKVSKIREDTLRSDGCLVVPCNRLLHIKWCVFP